MRLYLYLTRRDKKGLQIITILHGNQIIATRLTNLKNLFLPDEISQSIQELIDNNKMYWEPWIESANDYNELKNKLQKRGYTNLPIHSPPMLRNYTKIHASTIAFKKPNTMIKKKLN